MFKTCTPSPERPGIIRAIETIMQRIRAGEETTAVVLPPRYGKSDAIRLSALEAVETELTPFAIVLTPWTFLRDQLVTEKKIRAMIERAKCAFTPVVATLRGDTIKPKFWDDEPPAYLYSMTISQAQQEHTLRILRETAKHCREVWNQPLLVHIDEGHTVANKADGWGEVANTLRACGAHIVLWTGTPDRADNLRPFGFRVKEVKRDADQRFWTFAGYTDDGRLMRQWEADRVTYRLEADVDIRLKEAWGFKLIAQIQPRWVTCKYDKQLISELHSKKDARIALRRATRNSEYREEAVQLFVRDIAERRHTKPTSAGIVFVGNDSAEDGKDEHAHELMASIEKHWLAQFGYSTAIAIATMDRKGSSKRAADIIERFVGEERPAEYDVIIVKQMGGVGLDMERLKTALDMSLVRTTANTTQRWLRVGTLWNDVQHGTLILPNDPITRQMFSEIVASEGGEFTVTENETLITEIEVEDEEHPSLPGDISDVELAGASDLVDYINSAEDRTVDIFLQHYPQYVDGWTRPQLAKHVADLQKNGLVLSPIIVKLPSEATVEPTIINKDAKVIELRNGVTAHVKALALAEFGYRGANNPKTQEFIDACKHWMGIAKTHAGISVKAKLKTCQDIPKLTKALELLRQLAKERRVDVA